ncbi:hypothetical protein Dimus_008605 [Dionaea muscipula]
MVLRNLLVLKQIEYFHTSDWFKCIPNHIPRLSSFTELMFGSKTYAKFDVLKMIYVIRALLEFMPLKIEGRSTKVKAVVRHNKQYPHLLQTRRGGRAPCLDVLWEIVRANPSTANGAGIEGNLKQLADGGGLESERA